jgi:heme A synthase
MRHPGRHRLVFAVGLLTIAVLYTAYSLYVLDPDVYMATSRKTRHFYKFATVLIVYGIGLLTYRRSAPAWLLQLWHILYAGGLALLLLLALYYAWVSELPTGFRNVISNFHEFMICPIPYVIAGILGRPSSSHQGVAP